MPVEYLSGDQIKQAKEILSRTISADRNVLLFMVAINTGLRSSDLITLTLNKLQNYSITMKKTGKKVRMIIPPELMEDIKNYCEQNKLEPDDYLFTTMIKRDGKLRASRKHISYMGFKEILNRVGEELHLTLGTHSLRKTFGKMLYLHCRDINIVAAFLGHTDITSTIRYIGITDEVLENVRGEIGLIGG